MEKLLLLVPVCLLSRLLWHPCPAKPGSKVHTSSDLSDFVAERYEVL